MSRARLVNVFLNDADLSDADLTESYIYGMTLEGNCLEQGEIEIVQHNIAELPGCRFQRRRLKEGPFCPDLYE